MTPRALLALTSHGNAPYLMAARFAYALGNYPVILPWYYGKTQAEILLEEVPEMRGRVYLSAVLGALFSPLLLEAGFGKPFAQLGAELARGKNPRGARAIEDQLAGLLRAGISAEPLDGGPARTFHGPDLAAVLNTALPLRVALPRVFFFFTARMSGLYGSAPIHENRQMTESAVAELQPFASLWREVEDTFSAAFTPRIHALSGSKETKTEQSILTPPLAFQRPAVNKLRQPGVLFVPSGTRTDMAKLHRAAEALPAGFTPLVLGSSGSHPDYPADRFTCVSADVYGDPLLKAVISRGGWGTQWECLANRVPSAMVRTTFVEDPEIGHTQQALERLKLAAIVDESLESFLSPDRLNSYRSSLEEERQRDTQLFGEMANNGFAFMAKQINDRGLMDD